MRDEYDIKDLNPKPNPYAKRLKQQITINIYNSSIEYFKELAAESGIPYQTLINIYLDQCAKEKKKVYFG